MLPTDKSVKVQKRLEFTSIEPYQYQWYSPIDWLRMLQSKLIYYCFLTRSIIDQTIQYNSAWLLINSVMGYAAQIPQRDQTALSTLGLQHIIAVSGFHISFLMMLTDGLISKKVDRRLKVVIILALIGCYWLLIGLQASVNRAMLMGMTVIIIRKLFFLQLQSVLLLIYVALIWLIIDPREFLSVSFQLSYLATLGIITFFSQKPVENNPYFGLESGLVSAEFSFSWPEVIRSSFLISLVAQLYTFPIIWYHFGQYPLVSIGINVLLFWLPPALIVIGLFSFVMAGLSLVPQVVVSNLAQILLTIGGGLPAEVIVSLLRLGEVFSESLIVLPELSLHNLYILLSVLVVLTLFRLAKSNQRQNYSLDRLITDREKLV